MLYALQKPFSGVLPSTLSPPFAKAILNSGYNDFTRTKSSTAEPSSLSLKEITSSTYLI
jgi:hypothetical protein